MSTIYAIGHSTHPWVEFRDILLAHRITRLVDIRTVPKSRNYPQFNQDALKHELPKAGIAYHHLKELGGLRRPAKDSINLGWENTSFRGYADYMQTREFVSAIRELMRIASGERLAIMCAEGNPFRCHRSLVADALVVRGVRVMHISSKKSAREHKLTPFARVERTRITYPRTNPPKRDDRKVGSANVNAPLLS